MHANRLPLFGLSALLLTACVGTTSVPPLDPADVPPGWVMSAEESAFAWPDREWWRAFLHEELNDVIGEVQENNLDLANNRRNLESAQITLREAGFDLLPVPLVRAEAGWGFRDTSGNGGSTSLTLGTGASFTYNDILSRAPGYERSLAEYDSRQAQTAAAALNTLGTAASTYFQILLLRDRIAAAEQNVANAETIGAIARARVDAGTAIPIDALQQQIAIERERANLRSLVQSELAARASLALLMGRGLQQELPVRAQSLQELEVPGVQPGVPSDLLHRRPDLVQAEADLRRAAANVDVVRSALFPQISLTGGASSSSSALAELVSSPDTVLTVSASLVQTLLDNGRRTRNVAQARLSMESSVASYRRAVLSAFNEIEVLLSNIQLLEQQGEVAQRNLLAAEESFQIAQVRYDEGVADFQTVLLAQNTLFSSRNAVLDNKLLQLNAVVGLYQALGGGWEPEARPARLF